MYERIVHNHVKSQLTMSFNYQAHHILCEDPQPTPPPFFYMTLVIGNNKNREGCIWDTENHRTPLIALYPMLRFPQWTPFPGCPLSTMTAN